MIQINQLVLSFDNKKLLKIDNLTINYNMVIGLVGDNGSGKTTLGKTISNLNFEFSGSIINTYSTKYFGQTYLIDKNINKSSGEYSKEEINKIFNNQYECLILDEIGVHLDLNNKKYLVSQIKKYKGLIILISNDRDLINETAEKIFEIEEEKLNIYNTNYKNFVLEKDKVLKNKKNNYLKYLKEKEALKKAIQYREQQSNKVCQKNKKWGSSESKFMKWNTQGNPSIHKNKKSLQTKYNNLESPDKIYYLEKQISFKYYPIIKKSILFSIDTYNYVFKTNKHIAVIGKNGAGKTTLLSEIYKKYSYIYKIGYLTQTISSEYLKYTVIEYINIKTQMNSQLVRKYLAQFKYKEESYFKKLTSLSEGEKIQLNLSILLNESWSILLMDEPSNFLDLHSIEILENALNNFEGTLIIATHDQGLIDNLNLDILSI